MQKRSHCATDRPQYTAFRPHPRHRRRERGVFAVMTAVLILVILGFCGFALELSRLYNRKVELQTIADGIALAAAAQLNGTKEGIDNALSAASRAGAQLTMTYNYGASPIVWSDNAIRFSSAPSGSEWMNAGGAKGQAGTMFYVEVDTARLDERIGRVNLVLLPVLPSVGSSAQTASRAVAGRSTINVMPLAICAMSEARASARGTELVEYGFRRGISYDLMQLNPDDNSKGAHFLVNPVAAAGSSGTSAGTKLAVIQPFVCTGTLAMPQVTAGKITVEPDFPLKSVYRQINSRFGSYTSPCTANGAPPDTNIKEYTGALSWMTEKPKGQSAELRTTDKQRFTLADLAQSEIPAGTTADLYGPLWIYAKAAKYSGYKNGEPEPEPDGYPTFTASTDWSTLYTPGPPKLKGSYPSPSPYKSITQSGGARAVANRRVLNIPLLRCPVPAGSPTSAEILAIAKFLMTAQATENELFGEFTGLARPESLGGQVELYP